MADVEQVPRAVADEAVAAQINPPAEATVQPAAEVQPAVQANEVRCRMSSQFLRNITCALFKCL